MYKDEKAFIAFQKKLENLKMKIQKLTEKFLLVVALYLMKVC